MMLADLAGHAGVKDVSERPSALVFTRLAWPVTMESWDIARGNLLRKMKDEWACYDYCFSYHKFIYM